MSGALSRTPLVEFRARAPFRFRPDNASPAAEQEGRPGERYLTGARQFAAAVLARNPQAFEILGTARIGCLPREDWGSAKLAGRRVLFLLPGAALGNNVCVSLFLHALMEQRRPARIGVACAEGSADVFLRAGGVDVKALWFGRSELKRWQTVIDLGHLESRRNIELWPVDMEADLLDAFGLAPSVRFSGEPRPLPRGRPLKIGALPLASSPLRTLPPEATRAVLQALAPMGEVTLCLNRRQHQGVLYAKALEGRLPPGVRVVDAFASIGALMDAVAAFDYLVLADSGPAHMSKLAGTPGVAVYSSAPGDVLQGRHRNLARFTVPFEGPHCRTPCGLAKLRETAAGEVGCMGSLGVGVDALPATPKRQDPALVERLLLREPVPCMAGLAADPRPLVDFVLTDLEARRR
jgi:hypothetical protein